jgi:hypothetical protein
MAQMEGRATIIGLWWPDRLHRLARVGDCLTAACSRELPPSHLLRVVAAGIVIVDSRPLFLALDGVCARSTTPYACHDGRSLPERGMRRHRHTGACHEKRNARPTESGSPTPPACAVAYTRAPRLRVGVETAGRLFIWASRRIRRSRRPSAMRSPEAQRRIRSPVIRGVPWWRRIPEMAIMRPGA